MDSTKKISFGFNKLNRKPNILLNKEPAKQENSKVQLIEYLEEQSIKVIGDENIVPVGPLVIPMKTPNKKLINLVDIVKNDFKDTIEDNQDKTVDNADTGKDDKALTLDELAAKELINGMSNSNSKNDVTKVIEVPATEKLIFEGEKESSLDDYESVPVDQFGKALLRGMGWKDGEGIGKNQQLVKVAQPVIRPKGMGLGADSITKKTDTPAAVDRNGKVLTCVKGAYVKVIAGYHKGCYGQILGFDDESGRFIIKLTLTNINVSLNEFLVTPVTKEDYNKNSKVLNNAKYEEYLKQKEHSKQSVEKQVKKEPEESDERSTKISIKKEQNSSSNDEKTIKKTDYTKVEVKKEKYYTKVAVKKEKNSDEEKRRSRSHEEYTRKGRESKHKSKDRNKTEKSNNSRRKNDTRRYSNSDSESEDNRRTNKYDSDEEYARNKSNKRYTDKSELRKGKKANRKDKSDCEYDNKQERRAYNSRRHSDSESEDRKSSNKAKKRDSEEDNAKYERKSRKHSRNKRYNGSDSESEGKYEKKSYKKDKYRDRSKHNTKDKRK